MKTTYCIPGMALLLLSFLATSATAQFNDDWCDNNRWNGDNGERFCEVRTMTLSANRDIIRVDGRQNGGISVTGWNRDEIQIEARVQVHARSESRAAEIAEDVEIRTNGTIEADGPDTGRRESYSVSYRIHVPFDSNLDLQAHNGGISIEDVNGDIAFYTLNGGVSLKGLSGDVSGLTTNGGLHIDLEGDEWNGDGMDVKTTNGGVNIVVPEDYSANLESRTVNGRVRVDFPVTVQGRIDRRISTTLGNGGRTIRAITTNGGVKISRN